MLVSPCPSQLATKYQNPRCCWWEIDGSAQTNHNAVNAAFGFVQHITASCLHIFQRTKKTKKHEELCIVYRLKWQGTNTTSYM